MKSFLCSLSIVVLASLFTTDATACAIDSPNFTTNFRNLPNEDLNDYSRIFIDAEDPDCAVSAMWALTAKIQNELAYDVPSVNPYRQSFQQWLDGYLVAAIFAAAHRLGANGWGTQQLDDQLAALEARFEHFVPNPVFNEPHPSGGCGGDALNTCMDDLLGTASGYAWMAAYQSRRPNRVPDLGAAKRELAEQFLRAALTPVQNSSDQDHGICLRLTPIAGSATPLCNTTDVSKLTTGEAQTLSVNGSQQMIAYGFGLMTSVGIAKMGLEEAGSGFTFNDDEKKIAKALFEEAQRHVNASSEFADDCFSSSGGQLVAGVNCGGGYRPNMYRLKPLYDSYFNGVPMAGSYNSNYFDENLFVLGSGAGSGEHFSYNRYVGYGIMANTWVEWRQNPNLQLPQLMPYDTYNPIGYLEQVGASGLAQGWACDQDKPDGRIHLDFYVDGWTLAAEAFADSTSEGAINSLCGGGSAHRFWVQLPAWTQGKQVRVHGIDYTWHGDTELACLQSPQCGW